MRGARLPFLNISKKNIIFLKILEYVVFISLKRLANSQEWFKSHEQRCCGKSNDKCVILRKKCFFKSYEKHFERNGMFTKNSEFVIKWENDSNSSFLSIYHWIYDTRSLWVSAMKPLVSNWLVPNCYIIKGITWITYY